jgi:hypothetical protein
MHAEELAFLYRQGQVPEDRIACLTMERDKQDKTLRAALKEREHHFQAILQNLSDMILLGGRTTTTGAAPSLAML